MVEGATLFRKSGFNDEDAAALAVVAAQFQNIADTSISAEEAASSIVSQLRAFGQDAEYATTIINAYNEVANNFSVGTNDLSTAMEIASASLATYNNEFEQIIGLVTAGTEIMTGRSAQVARGLATIASRIASNKDALEAYGIEVELENGALKSTYDVLKELKPQWDAMSDAQRVALGDTLAGQNQYKVLASVMQNFDTALRATETAYHSAGSAARENARAMESLESKTQLLKSTFQDFANNVLDDEVVGGLLGLANGFLKLANTDLGQFVTQVALLSGISWGATSLLNATNIIAVVGSQIKNFVAFASLVPSINSISSAFSLLSMSGGALLPILVGLSGAIAGAIKMIKWWDEVHPTLEEANAQLESNKKWLEEINALHWTDRTADILAEKDALEEENAELERRIDLLRENNKEEGKGKSFTLSSAEGEYRATVHGAEFAVSAEEVENLKKYGHEVREVAKSATYTGDALRQKLADNVKYLTAAIASGTIENDKYAGVIYNETIDALNELAGTSTYYQGLLNELNAVVATGNKQQELVASSLKITKDAYDKVAKAQPAVIANLAELNGEYYIETETLKNLIITSDQYKNGRIKDEYDLTVSVIENAQARIQALQAEMDALEEFGKTATDKELAQAEKLYGVKFNQVANVQSTIAQAQNKLSGLLGGLTWSSIISDETGKATSTTDAKLEALKNIVSLSESELDLLEAQGASEDAQTAKMREIQDALHNQAEYMRSIGSSQADINALSVKWWDYEHKITTETEKQLNNLKQQLEIATKYVEIAQGNVDTLTSQASIYNQVFTDYIDRQISELEGDKSGIEDFYDNQINALKEANEQLDAQIQKEMALKKLAEAKDKRLFVYKNGKFQYVEDIDAISEARAGLTELEREQQLEAETKRLEELKSDAISAINEQIETWEKYRNEWEELADDVGKSQDDILYEQQLATRLEGNTWTERLDNLENYVNDYKKLLAELQEAQKELNLAQAEQGQLQQQIQLNEAINSINEQMMANSKAWHTASAEEKKRLEQANRDLAAERDKLTGQTSTFNPASGTWSTSSGGGTSSSSSSSSSSNIQQGGKGGTAGLTTTVKATLPSGEVIDVKYEDGKRVTDIPKGTIVHTSGGDFKYARGTLSAHGGLSLVGEQGPEMRVLGQGDGIIPADITRNLWDWGKFNPKSMMSTMSQVFNIDNLTLPNVRDAESLVSGLKQMAYQRAYQRA